MGKNILTMVRQQLSKMRQFGSTEGCLVYLLGKLCS